MIAEYERAKIAERYRRGKLFRPAPGKSSPGRLPRLPPPRPHRRHAAHLKIYEPEADVVRRIFTDRAAAIGPPDLPAAQHRRSPHPRGRPWGHSTLSRLLRNEAYIGRLYFNRTETISGPGSRGHPSGPAPTEEWIPIRCPRNITTSNSRQPPGAYDNTNGARAALNPVPGYSRGLSGAGCAMSAPTATRCAAETAAGTATATAATTTRSAPGPRPPLPGTQHPRRRAG